MIDSPVMANDDIDYSVTYRGRDPGVLLVMEKLRENWNEAFETGRYDNPMKPRTQEELGGLLKPPVSKQGVNQWQRVPSQHCRRVAEILDIPEHKLRPDLYGPPRAKRAGKK